jgi:hypothetical protein
MLTRRIGKNINGIFNTFSLDNFFNVVHLLFIYSFYSRKFLKTVPLSNFVLFFTNGLPCYPNANILVLDVKFSSPMYC